MATRQTSSKSLHAVTGALLLSLGLLLLFANLDEVAARVSDSFSSTAGAFSTVIEIGLAGMRAVQAYFFDHHTFQAGLHSILVSFWPLVLVIIGATLLRSAISKRYANPRLARTFSPREYESES
ncbi:MAG: hypothetical protein DMG40_22595 [Acidobacteria bacterium]|nr:MAG: hypothetical protein DMG40_22595 [Acidobacteriota bacterium]